MMQLKRGVTVKKQDRELQTVMLSPHQTGILQAAALLVQGEVVAFPTETVYGLGADASNAHAVAAIYAAKARPQFNPLIAHIADLDWAMDLVEWSRPAAQLAEAFWPGPLTLVLPLRAGAPISKLASAGLPSLALRMPDHPVARTLLKRVGRALVAPSANPSGRLSPTRADHVAAGLRGRIAAIVDGGTCEVGLESTICDLRATPQILRAGAIGARALGECLGQEVAHIKAAHELIAPGQMASHYAPRAALRLNALKWYVDEARLGFGTVDCDLNLSPSGDLREAAANLFAHLHMLDAAGHAKIAISPIPDHGIGVAINDRLSRAAHG